MGRFSHITGSYILTSGNGTTEDDKREKNKGELGS